MSPGEDTPYLGPVVLSFSLEGALHVNPRFCPTLRADIGLYVQLKMDGKMKQRTDHVLQSPAFSLLLHWLQRSPEVGFVERDVYPALGSLVQFLHQCHLSLPFLLRHSVVVITSVNFCFGCYTRLIFNIDDRRTDVNIRRI